MLSLDQKSAIQASGRIRARLPMKKDRGGNMTPDHVRRDTTTLSPAFIGCTSYLDDYNGSSRPLAGTTDPNGISEKLI